LSDQVGGKMFNEAKLRGINMRKLRQESFTSQKHIEMVKLHEARVAIIWDAIRWPDRPMPEKIPALVAPAKSVGRGKVKEVIEPTFTESQLRVAQAALKNMEK